MDAQDQEFLVEQLRRARIEARGLALRGRGRIATGWPAASGDGGIAIDAINGLADVDARLPVSLVARRLLRRGFVLPLARPLPFMSVMAACAAVPFFVEGLVQQAQLLTLDGDAYDTPAAPRHAAGPSLLGLACAAPPLAVVVRARMRVLPLTHVVVQREVHDDEDAAAMRVRALHDEGRAFLVEARGRRVLSLHGSGAGEARVAPSWCASSWSSMTTSPRSPLAQRAAGFVVGRALRPGDVGASATALRVGDRVVGAPYLQRAAVLSRATRSDDASRVVRDLSTSASALAAALVRTR